MNGLLAALVVVAGGVGALLLIGLGIRFQISCLGRLAEADQTRGLPKRGWEIVILLVPTFGGILYLLFGRAGGQVS
jgi:Phospholipase_D-nuclease N-terminal